MNTEIIIHPKLQHVGLTTANLQAMLDWYREVIGLTVNHIVKVPAGAPGGPPFTAVAFASNDEVNHRISIFKWPTFRPILTDPVIPGFSISLSHTKLWTICSAPTFGSRTKACCRLGPRTNISRQRFITWTLITIPWSSTSTTSTMNGRLRNS